MRHVAHSEVNSHYRFFASATLTADLKNDVLIEGGGGMKSEQIFNTALLLLRLILGVIFAAHGMQKLFGAFGGPGLNGVAGMFKELGFSPALFWAWIVALSEGLGGLALILGVLPRIFAGLIAIVMLVAILKVHGSHGLFAGNGGMEYPLLILTVCIFIILVGAGKFSLYNKL